VTVTGAGVLIDPNHPRPFLQRDRWSTMDGTWDFAVDADARLDHPNEVTFDQQIVVAPRS